MTDTVRTRFEMGRVIGNTFEVLGSNFVPFVLASLVLSGLPSFIQTFIAKSDLISGTNSLLLTFGFSLLKLVLSFVLQGALVTGAISSLNGKRIGLGAMLARGGAFVLPLFGLAILQGLAIGFATLLLVVPGLILLTMWSVTVPALVVEKQGVVEALGRSGDLTRGRRWAVFGLLVVYVILFWIVAAIFGVLLVVLGGLGNFTTQASMRMPLGYTLSYGAIEGVVATLLGALSAAGASALYYELRLTKEGVAPQAVLDTFT